MAEMTRDVVVGRTLFCLIPYVVYDHGALLFEYSLRQGVVGCFGRPCWWVDGNFCFVWIAQMMNMKSTLATPFVHCIAISDTDMMIHVLF
jgi:hypothetical protein